MSTTIYDGFRVTDLNTLEDAREFIETIRFDLVNEVKNQKAKEILSLACLIYDMTHTFNNDYFDEGEKRVPLLVAYKRMNQTIFKDDHMNQYSIGITHVDGQTLGMPFFPNLRLFDIILKQKNVERYGYWDSTDKPDEVSNQEWKERKRLWTKALAPSWTPSEKMFTTVLVDERLMMPEDHHMERNFPTVEDRESNLIKTMAYEKARDVLEQEERESGSGEEVEFFRILGKAEDYANDFKKDVKGHIQKNLKLKDLEQTLPKGEK